jgi:hypothetical protein
LIDNQTAARRFNTWLLGAFGAAAITLTAIGLYSLLAYLVALRRHEMAVRLAIGGTSSHVLGLIVRHVAWVVGIGMSLGMAGALAAARSMRGLLFGIEPWDPLSQTATIVRSSAVFAWRSSPVRRRHNFHARRPVMEVSARSLSVYRKHREQAILLHIAKS